MTMPRWTWTLVALTLVAGAGLLAGCGPAEPPPVMSIAQACAPESNDKRAAVIGYIQADAMVFCTDSCTLDFAETPDGDSPLSPYIVVGDGSSQMRELPDNFQMSDLQITAQDGTVLTINDRMRLSGTMTVNESVCLMEVTQVDAAP
jgi:hypothetical protein